MSMAIVDTIVAGHISTIALAGLGLGANFFWTFTAICTCCMLPLDTFFSQSFGARDEHSLQKYFVQSFWLCAIVAAASTIGVIAGLILYLHLTPPTPTTEAFAVYVRTVIWCLPSIFLFFPVQRYWQARHRVLPFTIIIIAANVLNLAACLAFGLGDWGFPRLGVQGLALATVISRYAMLFGALAFTWWQMRPASLRFVKMDWNVQRQFFRLGLPAASHAALEIGAFGIATLVVGVLGAVPLAAHHVCLMMASFTFMFPLGFSAAAAVRVGTFLGAQQPERARRAGWLCIGISAAVMAFFGLCYLAFARPLLLAFTQDLEVIRLGTKILVLVALFQIADGLQVSTTGALRGLGNTRAPMIANFLGHYPIGLALGFLLCFYFGFGVVGLWTGLSAGLVSVAIMLLAVWFRVTRDVAQLKPMAAHATIP